jgi:hypothetical protein
VLFQVCEGAFRSVVVGLKLDGVHVGPPLNEDGEASEESDEEEVEAGDDSREWIKSGSRSASDQPHTSPPAPRDAA